MKNILIVICGVFFAVFSFWQVVFTQELIEKIPLYFLSQYGYSMEAEGFKKGIFFSISLDKVILRKEGLIGALKAPKNLTLKNVKAHFSFFPVEIYLQAQIFGGEVEAQSRLTKQLKMAIHNADLSLIGEAFGFKAAGALDANIEGDQVKFQMHNARTDDARLTAGYLPLNSSLEVKGLLSISSRGVAIRSLLLEGPDGYANIEGNISGGYLEGVAEFTPAQENGLSNMLIAYKTSQGNYKFPFKIILNN
jgi:hypothetical protein